MRIISVNEDSGQGKTADKIRTMRILSVGLKWDRKKTADKRKKMQILSAEVVDGNGGGGEVGRWRGAWGDRRGGGRRKGGRRENLEWTAGLAKYKGRYCVDNDGKKCQDN